MRNNEGLLRAPLSLFGKAGTLYVMDYETITLFYPTDNPKEPRREQVQVEHVSEWVHMWRHFIDCVRSGTQPVSHRREAKKAVELVAAVYRSLETGAPVALPLSG